MYIRAEVLRDLGGIIFCGPEYKRVQLLHIGVSSRLAAGILCHKRLHGAQLFHTEQRVVHVVRVSLGRNEVIRQDSFRSKTEQV